MPSSFSRHLAPPQTPPRVKDVESPWSSPKLARASRPMSSVIRLAVVFGLITTSLITIIHLLTAKSSLKQLDRIPYAKNGGPVDYLTHFEGHQDCGITSEHLYLPPPVRATGPAQHDPKVYPFCQNRAALLEGMSGGGRHGFDAPFHPKGCHYRWYTTAEICMILERFDAVVFLGDDLVRSIYGAFNILVRENVALGALQQWEMNEAERASCRCEKQFLQPECAKFAVTSSAQVATHDAQGGHPSPYACDRTPHLYLAARAAQASDPQHAQLTQHLARAPTSYKPIPIIHSLSTAVSLSAADAAASMDQLAQLAAGYSDSHARRLPVLWLGPVAAGHLQPAGQTMARGNHAVWHYTVDTTKAARARGWEALALYNLTLQARSWDGSAYGEGVGLVQAMMIVNWLSRLETT
ncbi:MAG: hypothetical protein M1826_007512 [Phylliscum demangeonii]|nr:MAG: hypothetical protein M1826_007512 [Phylliscum demangeonii]